MSGNYSHQICQRIEAGLIAYSCGDALGIPWEGKKAEDVKRDRIEDMQTTSWLAMGATSDDTFLTMLVAKYLTREGVDGDPVELLKSMALNLHLIKGIGPSTSKAIQNFQTKGITIATNGNTNGAAMRALPIGWALPVPEEKERRTLTYKLSRITHSGLDAIVAACTISALASWSLENKKLKDICQIALEESEVCSKIYGGGEGVHEAIMKTINGEMFPYSRTLGADPAETLAAIVYCLRLSKPIRDTMIACVSLGGDTDTTTALLGGLLGTNTTLSDLRKQLTWLDKVKLPEEADIKEVAQGLSRIRQTYLD